MNLADPTFRPQDQMFWEQLPQRNRFQIKDFHLVQTTKGVYCLDISRWFPGMEEFQATIAAVLESFGDTALPAAPASVWAQMLQLSDMHKKFERIRFQMEPNRIMRAAIVEGELNGVE